MAFLLLSSAKARALPSVIRLYRAPSFNRSYFEPKKCASPRRTNVFTHSLDLYDRYYAHVVCFTLRLDFRRSSDRDEMHGWNDIRNVRTRRMLGSRRGRQDRDQDGCENCKG